MANLLERSLFLISLLSISLFIKIYFRFSSKEGYANKYTTGIVNSAGYDVEYHDTIENIKKSDSSNILDSQVQVMVYGKNNYIPTYHYKTDPNEKVNAVLNVTVGTDIEVNSQEKGFWMAGKIVSDNGDGTYDIEYNNPDSSFTSLSQIPTKKPYIPSTSSPNIFLDDLFTVSSITQPNMKPIYDTSKFSITYDENGKKKSIIEKNVTLTNLRQLVTIPYNDIIGFPTYNKPDYFKYGGASYVPSYSDSVYLSKTFNFLPKSAYADS